MYIYYICFVPSFTYVNREAKHYKTPDRAAVLDCIVQIVPKKVASECVSV